MTNQATGKKEPHMTKPDFAVLRDEIIEAADTTPFDTIEEQIQAIPELTDDERAALWLVAWAYSPKDGQREMAQQVSDGVYDGEISLDDDTAYRLREVMAAVREHEADSRRRGAPRRREDDRLYRAVRRVLR